MASIPIPAKMIENLTPALAAKLDKSTYTPFSLVVNQAITGTPVALNLGVNTILARVGGGDILALPVATNTVIGRGATGDLAAISMSTLVAGLGIGASALTLTAGRLLFGQAGNVAGEIQPSALPLSGFGTATANINLAAFKMQSTATPSLPQDYVTKAFADANYNNSIVQRQDGNATAGSLVLMTLSFIPNNVNAVQLFFNGHALRLGDHFVVSISGPGPTATINATSTLDSAFGGNVTGTSIEATDEILAIYTRNAS